MNNRIYKFRAWDKEEKKMYIAEDWLMISGDGDCYVWNMGKRLREKDFILMQFTGLKDKNGKEIYENDLVSIKRTLLGEPIIGEIIYKPAKFLWKIRDKRAEGTYIPDAFEGDEYEVIGDIYSNPELLNNK